MFKSKHHSILGVDINSTAVRILELSLDGSHYSVGAYGSAALPDNAMDGHFIINKEAVVSSIKKILTMAPFSTLKAACAIPDALVISKLIQINDGLSHQDLEALVAVEAEHSIPYPMNEINIDFNVLGPSSNSNAIQDVLMVATKAEHVGHRVEVLALAGLELQFVDVESYAVERVASRMVAALPRVEKTNIAILEIGDASIHVYVLQGTQLIFYREEAFDGRQLRHPFKESMLLPIRRLLQFFFSAQQVVVDAILLAGSCAMLPGLAERLQVNLTLPTYIANPLVHMRASKKVDSEAMIQEAPLFMKACGLALRQGGF